MRKIITILGIILLVSLGSMTENNYEQTRAKAKVSVWICTGPKSKRYHATDRCRGLNRCSRELKQLSKAEAEERGYTPCKICY